MNDHIHHEILENGSTQTVGEFEGKPVHVLTAPGILPPFSNKVTGEESIWRVQSTWKAAQKTSAKEGGLQDRHQQTWRGWPSRKHRTTDVGKRVAEAVQTKVASPQQVLQNVAKVA